MKKSGFFTLAAASFLFLMSSCGEKCVVCDFADGSPSTEFCGESEEREAFEVAQELAAAFLGTTVECTND
jgi:hypothetical protein